MTDNFMDQPQLDAEARIHITEEFERVMEPKLRKHHARLGVLSCGFAGEAYEGWMLHFQSRGGGFEITHFEYDPEGDGLDLDL